MQKIKLLLILCTLSAMPSLQSASSSVLIKVMEHTKAASIKPVEVQIAQGAYGNKVVTISRNSNDIVTFDAQLLANHDFSGFIQEFKGADKDKAFIESAHQLFDDLNNHQINILVKALNEDISPARAETFSDNLDQHDLGWLTNKANFANISYIYGALTTKFASNLKLAQLLYNEHKINDDITHDIYDRFMRSVDSAIFSRIPHSCKTIFSDVNFKSAIFNADNSQVLIMTSTRVILRDIANPNQQTTLYTKNQQLDGYAIESARFNADCSQVLIATQKRILLIDIQNPNQPTILYTRPVGSLIQSATFNVDCSQVLMRTETKVIIIDLPKNQQTILYKKEQLDGCLLYSAIFNADNSKVLISTFNRVILIDLHTNQQIILYTRNYMVDHSIKSAIFNTDNSKILINTFNRVILIDLHTKQQTVLYTRDQQNVINSVTFNANNNQVLIATGNRVIIIDIHNPNQRIIIYTRDRLLDGYNIRSAAFLYADSKVFVVTEKRVILIDLNTNQQTILYTRDPQLDGYLDKPLAFNTDNSKVLIKTRDGVILCQISYLNLLKQLDLSQKLFLINASKVWKQNKSYVITSDEEQEMYNSLPAELQQPELFEIALGLSLERMFCEGQ